MGFRLRRSLQVAPGVRLNVSRSGLGVSAGVKGARHAVHSSGRRTTMVGNPIFGVGYMDQSTTKSRARRSAPPAQAPPPAPPLKPGLFAPKGEKRLWKAIQAQDIAAIVRAGEEFPDFSVPAHGLAGCVLVSPDAPGDPASNEAKAEALLGDVLESGHDPASHPFVQKYLTVQIRLPIAPGVEAELPLCRDAVGLALAEIRQRIGDLHGAIDAVEQLEPTTYAAVSLAELYSRLDRHEDVIDLTEGLTNEDDATALLLTYRGIALREQGYLDASLEAFREALRARSRDTEIRHLAYSERAKTYAAQGKEAMARRDLERILAADSRYEGVRERLEELR